MYALFIFIGGINLGFMMGAAWSAWWSRQQQKTVDDRLVRYIRVHMQRKQLRNSPVRRIANDQ